MSEEKRDVFISYHTSSAGDVVRKVSAALEGAGISCWYAPRDCGEQYAGSIVAAIRQCRVFLLILNEQSNMSAHVLNEINVAFDRFKEHEEITLLPYRVDQCTLSDDVYYYLGRIHIMDGDIPPELQRMQELVDRISVILGREPSRQGIVAEADTQESKTYRLTGSIVYPDSRFVGRQQELNAIRQALSETENKLFLVGMGGIGKSEIAKMYLKQHAEEYDVVLWVSFDTSLEHTVASDVEVPIQGLSRMDYPEDDERTYFQRKLRILKEITDRRVLIVMDNFDVSGDPDLDAFCSGSFGVLFTTRYHQECGSIPEVEVRELSDAKELMELFRAEYTRALDAAGIRQVEDIISQLDGHTLSIRLVASAMQSRRIAPEKMAALLREGEHGMHARNAKAADLIFGRLRQVFQLSTLTEEEQFLLKNLSLISLDGISVEMLFDWCGMDDFDVIDGLIQRSWVIHDPVMDEVHLHPLVSDLMREEVLRDPACCDSMMRNLHQACTRCEWAGYVQKQRLYNYAATAIRCLMAGTDQWRQAVWAYAWSEKGMGHHLKALELFQSLQEGAKERVEQVQLLRLIAHEYILSGDAASSLPPAWEAYELLKDIPWEELSPAEGTELLELNHRLCHGNREVGDLETSVVYGRQGLEVARKVTKNPENVGWANFHLASTLILQDKLDEAEACLKDGIESLEGIGDLYSANFLYDLLGQVLYRQRKFDEALELNTKARELRISFFGEEHSAIALNLENRGNIYRAMGEQDKAAGCYQKAVELYEKSGCPMRGKDARAALAALGY